VEAPPGTRGRFGGIPFKEDPNASRPQKRRTREGGAARESKNEPEKKERFARGGMPEKNAETCFEKMERISLPLPGSHADAAVCGGRIRKGGNLPWSSH